MLTPNTRYTFRNWDGTLECRPERFYQPRSEEQVREIVREVSDAGGTVRTFGAGHSWSPLVPTDDTLINLDRLDGPVSVDEERRRVTVPAGIRIKDLTSLLRGYGLGMNNLGSIGEQSIAGAISTATHGTGGKLGSLHTQIVGMNLVTGGGRLLSISEESDPELMKAARVSLGALGVITQVTIQCVADYKLELKAQPHDFDEVLGLIDTLVEENDRVRLYWLAGTDVIQVITMNRTDRPVPQGGGFERFEDWFTDVVVKHDFMKLLVETGYNLYHLPGLGVRVVDAVNDINQFEATVGWLKEERIDTYDRILRIPMPPQHQECEYAVPVERAEEAVRRTRWIIEENDYHVNFPVEVRFVAADEESGNPAMLSPAQGREVCYVGAYTYGEEFARPFFEGFEREMKKLDGKPHWGKHHTLTQEEARKLYPMYDRFNEIRGEHDPVGTFANGFIRDLFG